MTPFTAQERYAEDYDVYGEYTLDDGREWVHPRTSAWANSVATASGSLRLVGSRAKRTRVSTSCAIPSGNTAAGATPSLVRFGLYKRDPDALGYTLVASTANDTTIFAAATTVYTRNWTTPVTVIQGEEYLVGFVLVTAAAVPTMLCPGGLANPSAGMIPGTLAPVRWASVAATDLPASFTTASLGASGLWFHAIY
jgi:hypothetical protein